MTYHHTQVSASALAQINAVVDDDRIYQDIHDTADDVRSIAVSIREAAFRRDGITLRIHRAEFRREVSLLLGLIRDVAPLQVEVAK
jgi:hypothetical protein